MDIGCSCIIQNRFWTHPYFRKTFTDPFWDTINIAKYIKKLIMLGNIGISCEKHKYYQIIFIIIFWLIFIFLALKKRHIFFFLLISILVSIISIKENNILRLTCTICYYFIISFTIHK